MKKSVLFAIIVILVISIGILVLSSCNSSNHPQTPSNTNSPEVKAHVHAFDEWTQTKKPTCTEDGINERYCSCGEKQSQTITAVGHTEVIDAAVDATCTTDGKTEGKHCSVCNEILVAQTVVNQLGHIEIIDPAVAATCTTNGKSQGKHCDRCKVILVPQSPVEATGHTYSKVKTITEATCNKNGIKQYTCRVEGCGASYTESYSLPTYTATQIYDQSIKYVGEIVTYDKNGAELALGTGFVISSDGKIVTNYHVIEGAYSADITIDNKKYTISSVLAYDANIDLAVLKINATGLKAATVCKEPVSVGSTVYAIGSSRGMTNTYSQGIITYADRVVDGVSHVQHDASITHGNSGGPLINAHGEVIGINTWGISDSQNLNFAVFAGELDNLTYGSPLTLPEFYAKECDVFTKIKNFIVEIGSYNAEDNVYSVTLKTWYSSDYTNKYTRKAYYYANSETITFDLLINDGNGGWAYFVIDDALDGTYYWEFFDDTYEMSGTLIASTWTDNSLLGYSYNNIPTSSLRDTVRSLASTMITGLCLNLSTDFKSIGLTVEDLGFYDFY